MVHALITSFTFHTFHYKNSNITRNFLGLILQYFISCVIKSSVNSFLPVAWTTTHAGICLNNDMFLMAFFGMNVWRTIGKHFKNIFVPVIDNNRRIKPFLTFLSTYIIFDFLISVNTFKKHSICYSKLLQNCSFIISVRRRNLGLSLDNLYTYSSLHNFDSSWTFLRWKVFC